MGNALAGSTLEVSLAVPADVSSTTEFAALAWVAGTCALNEVPPIGYELAAVEEDNVCDEVMKKVVGGGTFDDVVFQLSKMPGDAMQDAIQTIMDTRAVGSFKLTLKDSTTIYFTGQVSRFSLTQGGGKNTINRREVKVFVHSKPVEV